MQITLPQYTEKQRKVGRGGGEKGEKNLYLFANDELVRFTILYEPFLELADRTKIVLHTPVPVPCRKYKSEEALKLFSTEKRTPIKHNQIQFIR